MAWYRRRLQSGSIFEGDTNPRTIGTLLMVASLLPRVGSSSSAASFPATDASASAYRGNSGGLDLDPARRALQPPLVPLTPGVRRDALQGVTIDERRSAHGWGSIARAVWPAVLLLVAWGCDGREQVLEHPTAEGLMGARFPEAVAGQAAEPPPRSGVLFEGTAREVRHSFGVMDGDHTQILGRVGDAALAGAGLFLLDDRLNRVVFLSLEGGYATRVAEAGPGPGEISIARGIAASDSLLVVGDERRVLHYYRYVPGSGWEWERDLRLDLAVLDVYSFPDGSIYVLGVSPERPGVIHEIAGDTITRSFGHPYSAPRVQPDEFLDVLMAEGRLSCDPNAGQLRFVPLRLPEILAFTREGDLRWVAPIPGYRQMAIHERAGGAVALGLQPPISEMHMLEWAHVSPAALLVQLGLYDEESVRLQTPVRLDSYLFDPETGTVLERSPLERQILIQDDLSAVILSNDPFPRVSW